MRNALTCETCPVVYPGLDPTPHYIISQAWRLVKHFFIKNLLIQNSYKSSSSATQQIIPSCGRASNFSLQELRLGSCKVAPPSNFNGSCNSCQNLKFSAATILYLYLYFPFNYNINKRKFQIFSRIKKKGEDFSSPTGLLIRRGCNHAVCLCRQP